MGKDEIDDIFEDVENIDLANGTNAASEGKLLEGNESIYYIRGYNEMKEAIENGKRYVANMNKDEEQTPEQIDFLQKFGGIEHVLEEYRKRYCT